MNVLLIRITSILLKLELLLKMKKIGDYHGFSFKIYVLLLVDILEEFRKMSVVKLDLTQSKLIKNI